MSYYLSLPFNKEEELENIKKSMHRHVNKIEDYFNYKRRVWDEFDSIFSRLSIILINKMREQIEIFDFDIKEEIIKFPIRTLSLSKRCNTLLKAEKIFTVGELINKTKLELVNIKGLGKDSINEIIQVLKIFGLKLREI